MCKEMGGIKVPITRRRIMNMLSGIRLPLKAWVGRRFWSRGVRVNPEMRAIRQAARTLSFPGLSRTGTAPEANKKVDMITE